jgi:hypothetical protein
MVHCAQIYELMYAQQVDEDIAARDSSSATTLNRDPKLSIRPYTELVGATTRLTASSPLTLALRQSVALTTSSEEFDAVVCGTG